MLGASELTASLQGYRWFLDSATDGGIDIHRTQESNDRGVSDKRDRHAVMDEGRSRRLTNLNRRDLRERGRRLPRPRPPCLPNTLTHKQRHLTHQPGTVADYTALDATTIPRAPITATTPNTQNSTTSLVEVRVSASAANNVVTGLPGSPRRCCRGSSPCRCCQAPSGAAGPPCRAPVAPAAGPCRRSGRRGCRRPFRSR